MPFLNGTIEPTTLGAPYDFYISLDTGWLTAVSVFPPTNISSNLGPEYAQIFIAFGSKAVTNKALILAQGIVNQTDGCFWTGKQLVEESMYLGFLIRSFGNTHYSYGYFLEQYCDPTSLIDPHRTDLC